MENEKLFPISINPNLCVLCQRCAYSCSSKAIFFKESRRYVDYDKCQGCLKCVEVCEHSAIEVISTKEGKLIGFNIDQERCKLCEICLENKFCFQNLFLLKKNEKSGHKWIEFQEGNFQKCYKCLKCFKSCPFNAILPKII